MEQSLAVDSDSGAARPPGWRRAACRTASLAALSLLLAWPSAAHERQPAFETFSIEDGLPQSQVRALRQDARGYLWVGTLGGGLSRFDGRGYETYTTRHGLPDDSIQTLALDAEGRLWIGTEHGLTIHDGQGLRPPPPGLQTRGAVHAVLHARDSVWLGSDEGVLRSVSGATEPVQRLSELAGVSVQALMEDRAGRVWIGTAGRGVARWEKGQLRFLEGTDGWWVRALLETRDGRVFIATAKGLQAVDGDRISAVSLGQGREPGGVNALLEDLAGSVWLGTDNTGVCRYREGEVGCFDKEDGLGSNRVWALTQDHEGSIWVGTYRGGLSRFLGGQRLDPRLERELGGVVVRSVYEDSRGRLWFATDDRGALVVDGRELRWLRTGQGLVHDFVLAVLEDRRGAMWFATLGGLSRFDGRSFRNFTRADGLGDDIVRSVVEAPDGAIWVGTNEGGVSRLDGERFTTFAAREGLNADAVNMLYVDGAGRLWAATTRGLSLYSEGRFSNASRELGLSEGNVYAVREDKATGDLWLGIFGQGLLRIPRALLERRGATGVAPELLGSPEVLSSDKVVSLAFDAEGQLWVGTETGVDRLLLFRGDPARRPVVEPFGEARGRGRIECIHAAALADRAGRVWFGTLRGPRLFDPLEKTVRLAQPRVWMSALGPALGDWSWTPWLRAKGAPPSVGHRENRLACSVEAVSLKAASRLRYQFMLEGFETAWSPVTASPQAFYPALPAGEFALRARASVDGRTWIETPGPFRFRVLAPLWRRGWFYAATLALVGFVLYGSHRLAVAQLEAHQRELQAEVSVRTLAEAELRRINRALSLLSDCNQALVRAADEPSLLREICRLIVEVGGYRLAWVGYAERDQARSVRPVASAGLDQGYVAAARPTWSDDERGRGPTGTAIRTGRPAIARDLRTHPGFSPWRGQAERLGFSSSIALPLARQGEVFGALNVYAAEPDAFNEREVQLLSELADDLAYGVFAQRARAERDRAEQALRDSEQTLRGLLNATSDSVFLLDSQGVVLALNEWASRSFGGVQLELLGRIIFDLLPPQLADARRERLLQALRTGRPVRFEDQQGGRWLDNIVTPLVGADGRASRAAVFARDVTERRLAEEAREREKRRFRALIENSSDLVSVLDGEWVIRYASPSTATVMGASPEEQVGRRLLDLVHPDDAPHARALLSQLAARPEARATGELRLRHGDGGWRWLGFTAANLLHEPSVEGLVLNSRDITPQKQAEAQLQHDALHDALTGLPNRALFVERLEWAIKRSARNPAQRFAVLFLDLDGFKLVNDSLGHDAGDRLLVALAPRLLSCLRASDTCARLGGDEFVMLLDEVGEAPAASEVAERVQRRLGEPFDIDGRQIRASASIGIVIGGAGYSRAEEVLRDVDIAMYRAKELGRSRHELFGIEMRASAMARLELHGSLGQAAERGELRVVYQPIVSLHSGRLEGFESLVRWDHPERGLLLPGDFIPLAEDGTLIASIDDFVLRTACRQLRDWRESHPSADTLTVHVNVSGRHFSGAGFAEGVERILEQSGVPPGSLQLEITESVLMAGIATAAETLARLRGLGVRVAIDNFGVGYSSLAHLAQLPVDTLKIDRRFVSQLTESGGRSPVVRAIVALARQLGMKLIAEGVETPAQHAGLRALGCESGQGFLISRPLARDAAGALIAAGGPSAGGGH